MKVSYIKYFFTYETDIPDGVGFPLFGLWHFLWLFVVFAGSTLYVYIYGKTSEKKQRRMEFFAGFSMLGWILLRGIYIAILHQSFIEELPLHLCSMTGILCAVHCVTKCRWLGQVLYAIGLPGAVLALIFPNWVFYPVIHFVTFEGFFFHMGIVMYLFCMLYSHQIVPSVKKLWQVMTFLLIVVTPIYFFNKHFGTNYMFVNWPSAGSPLVWLEHWLGNPGYLAGYAVLVMLCIGFMDLGYICFTKHKS